MMRITHAWGRRILTGLATLGLALLAGMSFGTSGGGGGGCPAEYFTNQFMVCYFSGTSGSSGTFLSDEWDSPSQFTPQGRQTAINREWASGQVIAGGQTDNVSGVWKANVDFTAGRYIFSVFADDGVRLFIDDVSVLDRWVDTNQTEFGNEPARYAVAQQLVAGSHRIRLEWYDHTGAAQVRLQWDKGPSAASNVWPVEISAFIVKRQDVCIAGQEESLSAPDDQRLTITEPNGQPFKAWKIATVQVVKKSQEAEARASNPLVYCFSFGLDTAAIQQARAKLDEFAADVRAWSFGALDAHLHVTELEGDILLTRSGVGFWVDANTIGPPAKPYVSPDTDFTIAIPGSRDIGSTNPDGSSNLGRAYRIPACGLTQGADGGLWGAGYAWISDTCLSTGVIVSEWGHEFRCAIRCIMRFPNGESFDTDAPGHFPDDHGTFPPCGQGPADTFSYYQSHYEYWRDPAGPWCGWPSVMPDPKTQLPPHPDKTLQLAENLMWHFDPSLSHYGLSTFTGNHCNDQRTDYGETPVDAGGNCVLPSQPPTVTLTNPGIDQTWVSGTYTVRATTSTWTKQVEFYIDGALVATDTASPYQYTWNTTVLQEGSSHSVYARAVDWGGVSSLSPALTVSVTNTDSDSDGFLNGVESYIGTNPSLGCGPDAWPPDFNNDDFVDNSDLAIIEAHFATVRGQANYLQRADLNGDGRINGSDVLAMSARLNTWCAMPANRSFEYGAYSPDALPTGWSTSAWNTATATFTWDSSVASAGTKSVKIVASADNDAYWSQLVSVQSNTNYVLSGWIRTENVAGGAGANLGIFGRWDRTDGVYNTSGWTYVELTFNSGTETTITVAARIGHWGATASGTAWFDNLRLQKVGS